MEIKDLEARQGNVEVTVEIVDKTEPREFEKFGKTGRVCNAKVKDATGEVTLTLWNEDIDKVNVGDKVTISNGWVSEWQGELQLSTGRFGKLEVVGKGDATESAEATEENSEPEKAAEEKTEEPAEEPSVEEEEIK